MKQHWQIATNLVKEAHYLYKFFFSQVTSFTDQKAYFEKPSYKDWALKIKTRII